MALTSSHANLGRRSLGKLAEKGDLRKQTTQSSNINAVTRVLTLFFFRVVPWERKEGKGG
jgi:hypothetical protein